MGAQVCGCHSAPEATSTADIVELQRGPQNSLSEKVIAMYRATSSTFFDDTSAKVDGGKRILITTDMSTECDDECALLWILAALNKRKITATIEMLMSDSQVRYQWMAYLFAEKISRGDWEVEEDGTRLRVGCVSLNCYLAHDADREAGVIESIQSRAPEVQLDIMESPGDGKPKKKALKRSGSLGGNDVEQVPGGHLDCIVIAGPVPTLSPAFFDRFTGVKCTYVVGTPGGINCPMPSWTALLAGLHACAPVLYLTPQFTRGVRFPRAYVLKNDKWNEIVKHTIFSSTLMMMAKRPEIPTKFGNWGLVLRLNVANAAFCRDWYRDVTGSDIAWAKRPQRLIDMVQAYVDRNSGYDRQLGAVVGELELIGVKPEPPDTPRAAEKLRELYRHHLFENTYTCVATTDRLIWQNSQNFEVRTTGRGFKTLIPRCGYAAPHKSLADTWGDDAAVNIVKGLPLYRLTPAYDVVAMICAVSGMSGGNLTDLGLDIQVADDSMGTKLLTEEEWQRSDHPIQKLADQSERALELQVQQLMA